jgi:hypothetical protein
VLKAELALTFNWGAAGYTLLGEVLARDWQPADAAFGWTSRTSTQRWARPGSGGADWMTGKRFRISGFTGAEADLRKVLLDTAVVQRWIDEPASNRGVLLRPYTAGKVSWLRSSEDANPDYRPTLLLWLE